MSDRIVVRGLRVPTHIGATDEERDREQYVVIDIQVTTALDVAAASDDLEDTVDYDTLVRDVAELVRSQRCRLLEHLAARIADIAIAGRNVESVTVEVAKERPPVPYEVGSISVRMERRR